MNERSLKMMDMGPINPNTGTQSTNMVRRTVGVFKKWNVKGPASMETT